MRRHALAALAALLLTACTDGSKPADPTRSEPPLPQIATDPCPAPADLLQGTPSGGGDRLPDVSLRCLGTDGEVRMRALGGQPYVVNLWASWCIPCRTEMPAFQQVKAALEGKVGFLGVNTKDREPNARSTVQNTAITYPSVIDTDEKIRRHVNARSLPATVFVGADGLIKEVRIGELTAEELRRLIREELGVS